MASNHLLSDMRLRHKGAPSRSILQAGMPFANHIKQLCLSDKQVVTSGRVLRLTQHPTEPYASHALKLPCCASALAAPRHEPYTPAGPSRPPK
jgi:hypothetical protein